MLSEQSFFRVVQVTFVLIIVALLIPAFILFADGTRLHRRYYRAMEYLRQGQFALAAKGLEACVTRRPRDLDGLFNLAIARFNTGDYERTAQVLESAHAVLGEKMGDYYLVQLDYVRAVAHGDQPVGMVPRMLERRRGVVPREYSEAQRKLASRNYPESAALYETCLGKMPSRPGEVDTLWGLATARFHTGDLDGSLEALDAIRAAWGKEPSKAFEAVVAYVKAAVPDEPFPLGMPLVLRMYATRDERQRQMGLENE